MIRFFNNEKAPAKTIKKLIFLNSPDTMKPELHKKNFNKKTEIMNGKGNSTDAIGDLL